MVKLTRTLVFLLPLAMLACATTDDKATDDTDTDTDTVDSDTDTVVDTDDTDEDTDVAYWPTTAADYEVQDLTYLYDFQIPTDTDEPCCRDWGSVSKNEGVDNALSFLAVNLGTFIDLQAQLTATVEEGGFVALLDHRELPTADGTYRLGFFLGDFADGTDYEAATMGTGEFLLDPDSFIGTTGEPQVSFDSVSLTGGHMSATGGNFSISLALTGTSLIVPVKDVSMEADVTVETSGVSLSNGELSGYMLATDFYGAYNAVVAATCGCIGLTQDFFIQTGTTWGCSTPAPDLTGCTLPDEDICADLASATTCIIPFAVAGVSDIDTNSDTTVYEALSIGLRFSGAPGTLAP